MLRSARLSGLAREVSLVYTKSGEGEKENLMKASNLILCSQGKVLVLIWDSEKFCVHRRWIHQRILYVQFRPIMAGLVGYSLSHTQYL